MRKRGSTIRYYGLALLSTALALLLAILIEPVSSRITFALFLAAVIVSTWYGGVGPGLLAILLSALAASYFFLPPRASLALDLAGWEQLGLFILISLPIGWLIFSRERANGQGVAEPQAFLPPLQRAAVGINEATDVETAMQDAENALRESQTMFEGLFEAAPDAKVIVNDQGRIVRVNTRTETLFGYRRQELLGQSVEILIPEHLRDVHEGHRADYYAEPRIRPMGIGLELYGRRKNGTLFPVDVILSPVQAKEGLLVIGAVRDMTERKLAQERIKESEHQLRLLNAELEQRVTKRTAQLAAANHELAEEVAIRKQAEQALEAQRAFLRQVIDINPNFIFAKDRAGRFTLVNQAVAEAYGTTVEALIGKTDADFNPQAEEVEHFRQDDLDVLNSQQEKFIPEEVITDASGRVRWLQTVKRPLIGPNGQADQLLGVATDISERRQIEANLREQHEIIETVNRVGQILSAELDLQKLLQSVTDAATELSGAEVGAFFYNQEDEQGESYLLYALSGVSEDAFGGFPMPRNTGLFGATFRGEAVIRADDIRQHPQYGQNPPYFGMPPGNLPVVSYLAVPVISRRGEVLGGLFFGHSWPGVFTERAEQIVVGLAAQVAIALDNARLYQEAQTEINERRRAEEQLKASIQEKEVLLKEVHHRVKNNLQAVSNLLYLQAGYIQDQAALAMFRETQDRVKSIALIHEKLYQTRDLVQIDFADYISSLVTHLVSSYKVSPNAIKFHVHVDEGVSLDMDTAVPLGIIINELVSNSLKHAFPDGRTGEIWVELHTDGPDRLLLAVHDNGVGFPEHLDITQTESLGLQLVNLLAGHMRGTIALDRQAGTTVQIRFAPLREIDA